VDETATMETVETPDPLADEQPVPEPATSEPVRPARAWVAQWRRWRVRLAVVACVGWLVIVVAHRILSGRAYWWGPVDLVPPITFVAVPLLLLVVALLTKAVRWRLVAVTVLALALGFGYSGVNLPALWYRPPAAPADAIKLVTWNTEYWDMDMENHTPPKTTAEFYGFLRGLNADVYMLQEYAHVNVTLADNFSQARAIDQEDRLHQEFPGYTIVIAGRDITLTRLPVLGHTWLDDTPYLPDDLKAVPPGLADRPLFYRSQTLRTDIMVNGHVVSFYNSHIYQPPQRIFRLSSDPGRSMFAIDRFNFEIRRASYEAIAADMATNPNRIVLGGDFNTSPVMNVISMVPHRLVDQTKAISSLYPTTWQVGSSLMLWRLDWLFTSADVAVHRYDLVDPQGLSDHKAQQIILSAH
jgi:endonuclease/exonuclease/phosphatase family metal-dependent hydrolase